MIHPEHDRINYASSLMPPSGYELDKAICTTYSLDLEALLLVSMTLNYSTDIQKNDKYNKPLLYKALHDISKKIVIFHEAGQISFRNINNSFYLLLEKMLVPVKLDKKGEYYPAFHPKTWLLKYKTIKDDKSKYFYRFIVLSRNLTFDNSWDISISLEGYSTSQSNPKSIKIASFLDYICSKTSFISKEKQKLLDSMISEIKNVDFIISNEIAQDYDFYPLYGNNREIKQEILGSEKVDDFFVMSPFITKDIVTTIGNKLNFINSTESYKNILVTRRDSLYELADLSPEQKKKINAFVIKTNDDDENETIENEINTNEIALKDIHAKIFMIKNNKGAYIYLGSMNATRAAVQDNIEMMVKLTLNNKMLWSYICDILGIVKQNNNYISTFFEKTSIPENKEEKEDDDKNELKKIIKTICRMNLKGKVTHIEEKIELRINNFTDNISELIHSNFDDYQIKIRPIMINEEIEFFQNPIDKTPLVFKFDSVTNISEFFIIHIEDKSTKEKYESIIQISLIWDDSIVDNRESELLKLIFNDQNNLLNYIEIILSETSSRAYYSLQDKQKKGNSTNNGNDYNSLSIYEKLLKASVEKPEVINEFTDLLNKIGRNSEIAKQLDYLLKLFNNENGIQENE